MTTTFDRIEPAATRDNSTSRSRPRWPLFGVAAGVAALASAMVSMPDLTEEDAALGVDAIDTLDRGPYHVAFLLGLVAIACLFVASTGWKRWADQRAGDDLAARTIPTALGATAAVNIIGVSMTGSMALYLAGGTDEGWLSREGVFANFNYLDFGLLLGWWGAVVAALCVAALAFGRRRLLPRWMGAVSVLFVLPPIGMAIAMGLPGMPGLTMPIWLVVISVGMMFSRSAHQAPRITR
jgi:hypothetical protein